MFSGVTTAWTTETFGFVLKVMRAWATALWLASTINPVQPNS